ncbi:MAG: HAD family hydrolase [Deltaproteobacteria bacterium]|nr:HAD family hydrolase [Deltaproteobacteria bacterium]
MRYKAFFFDFDGVIADSVEVKTKAFAKLFEPFGQELVDKVIDHHRRHGGMTRVDKFQHYYKEFLKISLDDDRLQELCYIFSRLVTNEVIAAPEIPGAEDFLKKWHKKLFCFIVSATPDAEIIKIVDQRGLKPYFREVLGSSRSKQRNIEFLVNKYSLQPENCLFFGDAESDYRAAMACRIDFIGIVRGQNAPLLQVAPEIRWSQDFFSLQIE